MSFPDKLIRLIKRYYLLEKQYSGVLQDSITGPTLWNASYNDILELNLSNGVIISACVDNLAENLPNARERNVICSIFQHPRKVASRVCSAYHTTTAEAIAVFAHP